MILKHKDPIEPSLLILEDLLKDPNTPAQVVTRIKEEISMVRKGDQGELECAHFLDRTFKDSQNCMLLHDLRIELDGEVAQIDHLMINRFLECWILESKNFSTGIRINELGEFDYWTGKTYIGIPSPIEQTKRQATLLKKALKAENITLQRIGLKITPKIKTAVLISPKGRIVRPKKKEFDSSQVMKADAFATYYEKQLDATPSPIDLLDMARLVGKETVIEFGQRIASLHKPHRIDYPAKFGLQTREISQAPTCPKCGAPMKLRTAGKGPKIGQQFWGCSTFPKCRYTQAMEE